MTPKQLVERWVDRFNQADVDGLMALYAEDAVNHQVVMQPLRGRAAIGAMFATEFARAQMTCIIDNLFVDGDWAILEWRDPLACIIHEPSTAASAGAPWRGLLPPIDSTYCKYAFIDFRSAIRTTTRLRNPRYERS